MIEPATTYRPPWWYRGAHLQTLWGPLLRPVAPPPLRRERLETPDGDFLDLDWLEPVPPGGPLVVILHGLEGSSRSHYVAGLFREAARRGLRAVVMNFRSCSGELNRAPRLYHSGETSDLEWVLGRIAGREPAVRIGLVGVSLGGNVALKWLGERGESAGEQVVAAAAISTPFDLALCAQALDAGLRRALYTERFLRTMRVKIRAKAHLYDGLVDVAAGLRARTFAEYDRAVTAPIFGFADERDYWARSSSRAYLPKVRRPALLINAVNDPFIPPAALPWPEVAQSPWLEAAFVPEGGHAGFLEGRWGGRSWAEGRALAFLRRHLLG
ncbi:MAG TPA: alpha/beta fold hydrolase [Candidatus Methylomirabilis sp.]|nr:alpha/beta fold hydrolase [Candidatus Methylomirabilis sp.]